MVKSDSATHFSVVHDTTLDEMEVQNSETPLALLVLLQNILNQAPVSQEYHLARMYLLHVAHLDLWLHVELEDASPKNHMDQYKSKIVFEHDQ